MVIPEILRLADEKHNEKVGFGEDESITDALERIVPKARDMMTGSFDKGFS